MEMDRYLYTRLVDASMCFYRMYDAFVYLSGNGPEGETVFRISDVAYVTRQLSVYADVYDEEDEERYLKFETLMRDTNYDIEEKTDILLGHKKYPFDSVSVRRERYITPNDALEDFL